MFIQTTHDKKVQRGKKAFLVHFDQTLSHFSNQAVMNTLQVFISVWKSVALISGIAPKPTL